ncbi:hypothetical protein, partial [Nocardioides sp.]|uniref:hypothetical protein n=1 Tax=Nocardioides sp. TaxID=35761 RepID=UPI003569FDF2
MPARRPSTYHDVLARRLALLSADAEPSQTDLAPRVPIPGRHAARRGRTVPWLGDGVVPATLRGRIALGPAQVAVVAILVALGLAATTWWVVRADADPVVDLSAA